MSGRPTYTPGAVERIERLGENQIVGFFGEIPPELLRAAAGLLPSLPGFRPGTTTTVQRQLQILANKIAAHRASKHFSHSPEEAALYGLWHAWSQSQITETTIVRELLDNLDEGKDDETEGQDTTERMASALKALVASGTCAREALERFVTFSPFDNVDGLLDISRRARTATEIKRDSTLLDLPDRLHKDEARLNCLETKLDACDRSVTLLRTSIDQLRHTISDLRIKATEDRAAIGDLRAAGGVTIDRQKATEESLARLNQVTQHLADRVGANEKQADAIANVRDLLERQIAHIAINLGQCSEQQSAHASQLIQLTTDIQEVAATLKGYAECLAKFDSLSERTDQLETMRLELEDAKHNKGIAINTGEAAQSMAGPASDSVVPARIAAQQLSLESGLSVKPLRSIAEILAFLDASLTETGLKKSSASIFAEEILAAIASEQIVFFRGSFAVDVARKCALSLSGTSVCRIAIPLGMTDPSLFRQALVQRQGAISACLSAIVIEGINNSPLDVLRDVLLDNVSCRVGGLGRQSPTVIFGGLVDGAGSFPIEPSYLELGPVFDLEQMDWRRLRRDKLPTLGSISRDDWYSLSAAWDGKTVDYEEALQGARQLASKRNARVEANVVRAFTVLKAIRRDQAITPLQSVTFGWLAPYWQSFAAKVDDIDSQIDGGKCDGTVVDERLKSILTECQKTSSGSRG